MTNNTITFATSNKGKVAWLERTLRSAGLNDWSVEMQKMDLVEIQSPDIAEISLYKARQAYEALQRPVLVMDGGFAIHALNGFPGPYIRHMIDQMGVENMAKMVGALDDRSCAFTTVATWMDGPESYRQFHDTTADIYTLTDQVWPHDHPAQWSAMWRILVPSGLGYTKPLAALSEAEMQEYAERRALRDADRSCLHDFVQYLAKARM